MFSTESGGPKALASSQNCISEPTALASGQTCQQIATFVTLANPYGSGFELPSIALSKLNLRMSRLGDSPGYVAKTVAIAQSANGSNPNFYL